MNGHNYCIFFHRAFRGLVALKWHEKRVHHLKKPGGRASVSENFSWSKAPSDRTAPYMGWTDTTPTEYCLYGEEQSYESKTLSPTTPPMPYTFSKPIHHRRTTTLNCMRKIIYAISEHSVRKQSQMPNIYFSLLLFVLSFRILLFFVVVGAVSFRHYVWRWICAEKCVWRRVHFILRIFLCEGSASIWCLSYKTPKLLA